MNEENTEALRTAIAALHAQHTTLGDAVVELAAGPLARPRAALQRCKAGQAGRCTVKRCAAPFRVHSRTARPAGGVASSLCRK